MGPKKIVFLASGNGGSLKFVHLAIQQLSLPLEVSLVIVDRECGALTYARQAGLACAIVRYTRKAPADLQQILRTAHADIVITNIHKIIDAETLGLLPGRFINLHYSILPAFKGFIGMQTVEEARKLNVTILGATCHMVDELVDNGQCISQFGFGVNWASDSTDLVYNLVFRGACLALLQGIVMRLQAISQPTADKGLSVLLQLGRPMLFAPALAFDAATLDESFWQKLKDG